jgi:DNA-binding NarL/FixJ family response regulator
MERPGGNLPEPAGVSQWISVCVVAMHQIVLSALLKALDSDSFQIVSTTPAVGSSQIERMELPVASVYVIDSAGIPSGPLEIVRQIVSHTAKACIVVLAERFDESDAFPLLNLGVKGLIAHEFVAQQLPRALQAVAAGGFWVPRVLLSKFVDSVISKDRELKTSKVSGVNISRREREIFDVLLLNLSNKEIANRLNISERTVKFHVSNLLVKFNVQRRADLILLCYQSGRTFAERSSPLPTPQIPVFLL